MLRRNHRFFQSIQILRDAACVGLSFHIAYLARFSFPSLLPYSTPSSLVETWATGIILVVLWPLIGSNLHLYISRRGQSIASEFFDVLKTTATAFLMLVAVVYFVRPERYSRGVLVLWAGINVVLVAYARMATRWVLQELRRRGYNLRHVIIVGTGDMALQVQRKINDQHALGLRVLGFVADDLKACNDAPLSLRAEILGAIEHLKQLVRALDIDQVLVALPIERLGALKEIMTVLSRETVDVRVIPDFYQYATLCSGIEEFSGLPIINLQSTPMLGWNRVVKRSSDLCFGLLALIVASPVMLLTAVAIALTSKGPILYRQERVGLDGERFGMLKFRSMSIEAESAGAQMTAVNDPRVTVVGRVIRRLSIDELPQLINVVKGEMSLVGPRPEQPSFTRQFTNEIPRYALRNKIKSGMTGWAQINGLRGNTSISERIELDLYYIENWSLALDLKILVRTVLGGFLSPNAY